MGTNDSWSGKGRGYRPPLQYEPLKNGLGRFQLRRVKFRLGRGTSWIARIGLLGNIGWAIIAPTLLGVSFGFWLDTMYPSRFSWTVLLLPVGLFLGCVAAGYWFRQDFRPKD